MIKIITKISLSLVLLACSFRLYAFELSFNYDSDTILILASAVIALALPYLLFVIYKLRRSRRQLSLSEKRLKSTIEGSGDTLWDWNIKTGEVIRINDKYMMNSTTLMGFPPNKSLIHPHDVINVEHSLKKHFAEQTVTLLKIHHFGKKHFVGLV